MGNNYKEYMKLNVPEFLTQNADVDQKYIMDWDDRAERFNEKSLVTSNDPIQFSLEHDITKKYCEGKTRLFDFGCGNGATIRYLLDDNCSFEAVGGCDISEKLIEISRKQVPNGDFYIVDEKNDYSFLKEFNPDVVVHKRVLHNLGGRKEQRDHLRRLCEILSSGCRLMLITAFFEGLHELNRIRHAFGLPYIPEGSHNDYSRLGDVVDVLSELGGKVDIVEYASSYYLGSRVLQPFCFPDDEIDYCHMLNRIFASFPNQGKFGVHKMIVADL